jgi:hypothetical protein
MSTVTTRNDSYDDKKIVYDSDWKFSATAEDLYYLTCFLKIMFKAQSIVYYADQWLFNGSCFLLLSINCIIFQHLYRTTRKIVLLIFVR